MWIQLSLEWFDAYMASHWWCTFAWPSIRQSVLHHITFVLLYCGLSLTQSSSRFNVVTAYINLIWAILTDIYLTLHHRSFIPWVRTSRPYNVISLFKISLTSLRFSTRSTLYLFCHIYLLLVFFLNNNSVSSIICRKYTLSRFQVWKFESLIINCETKFLSFHLFCWFVHLASRKVRVDNILLSWTCS